MKLSPLSYFSVLVFFVVISCRKDNIQNSPPPVDEPVSDARTVLLKSIVEPGVPNPYFSLSYDANGFATGITFADSMHIYQLSYKNKRVDKVINTTFNQSLQYYYSGKHVSYISQVNGEGIKISSYSFHYNASGLLKTLMWFDFISDTDSVCTRKVQLDYTPGGNLSSYEDYRGNESDHYALKLIATHTYSNYDNGVNVDDFGIFKEFFSQLLFLPQVKLQKNNPGVEIIQGVTTDLRLDYHYRYQNGLPVEKSGTLKVTRGPNTGSEFPFSVQMNYY
jgi:hypothetical protein